MTEYTPTYVVAVGNALDGGIYLFGPFDDWEAANNYAAETVFEFTIVELRKPK